MIRLLILFAFIVAVAAVLGVIALSRRINRQQAARVKENNYALLCEACEAPIRGDNELGTESTLCSEHRTAMREVDRDTWIPEEA